MAKKDYSDLDSAPRSAQTQDEVVGQRPVSKLALVALIVGILTIPAAMMPVFGIIVAMIGVAIGIVALLRASRNGTQRAFAIVGLVLSILALGFAIFLTSVGLKAIEECGDVPKDQYAQCPQDNNK